MAATDFTGFTDLIPEEFSRFTVLPTPNTRRLVTSPVMTMGVSEQGLAIGGNVTNPRYFDLPDVDAVALRTNVDLTDNNVTQASETAVIRERGISFGAYDLVGMNLGADPLGAVEAKIRDEFWVDQYSKDVRSTLTGLITASGASMLVNDVTGDTDKTLSVGNWIDTRSALGDNYSKIQFLLVHSDTYAKLEKDNEIDFSRPSEGAPFGVWRGVTLIVDDMAAPVITVSAGVIDYVSFGFAPATIAMEQHPDGVNNFVMTEVERDAKKGGGVTSLVTRRRYYSHVKGTKWVGASNPGQSPANTALATASNWNYAFTNPKNYGWVAIRHKLA